tara:strand:+ start:37 stop:678 length:642 start_codon:yes stop_codon:yes gene_type:complete
MAITDGLATGCGDLQASGGIKNIFIREWNKKANGDVAPDQIVLASGGTASITSIADGGGSTSTWGVFETKLESPVLSVSGTAVGNANTYECTLAFNLPHFDLARRTRISELEGKCLQVMVQDTNDTYFVIGIGNTLTGGDGGKDFPAASHIGTRPQTFARIGSIEATTGAAFSDETMITVTLTCTQYELPRTYVSVATDPVVINASGLTVVIK